jgi:hypothetical protein
MRFFLMLQLFLVISFIYAMKMFAGDIHQPVDGLPGRRFFVCHQVMGKKAADVKGNFRVDLGNPST